MSKREQHTSDDAKRLLDEERPVLDDQWFAEADAFVSDKLVQRGRPKSDNPKQVVTIRLDPEIIDWFKRDGPGWQTRVNDELRKVAGL